MNNSSTSRIRLILLDDHGLFRASLGRLLASEPDLEVAGECGASTEVLEVLKSSGNWTWCCWSSTSARNMGSTLFPRPASYQGRFLIVAGSADVRDSAIALKLGASGIFLKSELSGAPSGRELIRKLAVVGGKKGHAVARRSADQSAPRR